MVQVVALGAMVPVGGGGGVVGVALAIVADCVGPAGPRCRGPHAGTRTAPARSEAATTKNLFTTRAYPVEVTKGRTYEDARTFSPRPG
jgi:hypothetical protein